MKKLNIKDTPEPNKVKKGAKVRDVFLASEEDRTAFFETIDRNEMPNKKLMEAAMRYQNELCKK